MATKIRLQRFGKKGHPFYHIVVADSRAKRDGKFIEKLGTYNPNTNPATIDIKFDETLNWVQVGAEMSDTARAILSYKGILYKNHLLKGIKKGALTEADVEKKFETWMKDKEAKIAKKSDGLKTTAQKEAEARLAAEKAVSDARAKEIAAKNTPEPEVEETPEAEVKTEEAPDAEEAKVEETPSAEAKTAEETPKGEVKSEEAPKAKAAEEAPKGEVKAEEAKEETKDKSAE